VKVTIELPASMLRLIGVLDDCGRADAALLQLAARAVDGVSRPGSWERQWLHQAFGYEWEQRLEPHPHEPFHDRPRKRR
jgi:hypothetical protein